MLLLIPALTSRSLTLFTTQLPLPGFLARSNSFSSSHPLYLCSPISFFSLNSYTEILSVHTFVIFHRELSKKIFYFPLSALTFSSTAPISSGANHAPPKPGAGQAMLPHRLRHLHQDWYLTEHCTTPLRVVQKPPLVGIYLLLNAPAPPPHLH